MELPNWFLHFLPRSLWGAQKTFIVYEQDFTPTTAISGRTDIGRIQLQAESHFLCIGGVASFSTADNVTFGPGQHFTVRISDAGSGAPLSDGFVPISHLFGTAQRPAIWSIPVLFPMAGGIVTEVLNNAAFNNNMRLGYWGLRLYPNVPVTVEGAR